jgi:hypothetical protein
VSATTSELKMTAAARKRSHPHDARIDDIGILALELADKYTESLRLVADSLRQVLQRRDSAHLLARYVVYARDVQALCDSQPVGFAEWLRACEEEGL